MRKEALEFRTLLEFEKNRRLVGVKFLFSKWDYDNLDVKEATHQMFFCMMVKAATIGHGMKVMKEHIYCSAASEVLGFSEPCPDVLSGKQMFERNMYGTEEAAADVAHYTPYLKHSVYGMCIQPLDDFEEKPDIVLAFCNPYTAMRIIQGYSYKYGIAKQICFAGMGGICTELMARSYQNQDMNVSFLCSGTRFAGEWKDDEVGIAFPYHMFLTVLGGVRDTMNTFEPDDKKEEILQRAEKNGISLNVEIGTNYHGSSLGVARIGVTGYRKKREKKGKKIYE